jgi:membrane fusion protein, multidrug efflux system
VQIARLVWHSGNRGSCLLVSTALLALGIQPLGSEPRLTPPSASISPAARGIVRALEQAAISTELPTRVVAIHFKEGDAFKKGIPILEFDCRRQRSALAAAEAQQQEMQLTVEKFRQLQRANSVGKNDLEVAEARLAKTVAESAGLRSPLDQCVVVAPFDGRIVELSLQKYEAAQPGKPFLSIASTDNPEIDLIVPSAWSKWIKSGIEFQFRVDELAVVVDAQVTRIGAAVDPISQTIKLSAVFKRHDSNILPGMSGTAQFADEKR